MTMQHLLVLKAFIFSAHSVLLVLFVVTDSKKTENDLSWASFLLVYNRIMAAKDKIEYL